MTTTYTKARTTYAGAPPPARRALALAALGLLVVGALADTYAVAHHLPYGFGGHGDPATVGRDWPSQGTALGPPLAPMVVLVLLTPVTMLRRWWGVLAELVVCLVAVAVLVGTLGEPTTRTVFTVDGFDAVQAAIRVVTLALALGVLATAAVDLRRRRVRAR